MMSARVLRLVLLIGLLYGGSSAMAAELTGRLEQGGLAMGTASVGADITLDGQPVAQDRQGHFVLGFAREAPKTMVLSINGKKQTLFIASRHWLIERVDDLPPATVTPDPSQKPRIADERVMLEKIRQYRGPDALFLAGVTPPLKGRISGVFGSQRILNGKPCFPHMGLDVAAPTGTPIHALTDGVVMLADPDLFFSGQTVILDHGLGLQSIYAHMSEIDVHPGQTVRKGDIVGKVGNSGRATGPHLHWGVNWGDTRLDPATVLAVLKQR